MGGARPNQLQDPKNAFQLLVSDWALEVDASAGAPPTAGRDGSIDQWLEHDRVSSPLLRNAQFPVIVECKWHDEDSSNLTANVLKRWGEVEGKLRKQAAAGWPDLYRPWKRTRGYLYCVAGGLPHQSARDDLKNKIKKFFQNLPADQRPPIEWVEVADWQNLRAEFDRYARLRDAWLGTGSDVVQDQATFEAGLIGFRSYLKSENLRFVEPSANSAQHPDRLLDRLERSANDRGVLLVGAGGVGKTRASVEIAHRAVERGWRVLHVIAKRGDATATVDPCA
jgi:hypothetical protein